MQEFWFCETCKSMNRASVQQCYRCHSPKSAYTMATVHERTGAVLTPGLDEEHREAAWSLMFRQTYVSAWKLGYVAAALLGLVVAIGFAWIVAEIATMVSSGSLVPVLVEDRRTPLVEILGVGLTGLFLATVVVHSVFLGLTSMDSPALGSGSARFDTYRAFGWWIESTLWWIRAALAFLIPPFLFFLALVLNNVIFGLILGVVWVVCAFWLLGDPITSLGKPRLLLADLYQRLAVPGASDGRIVTYWAVAWGTARGILYAVLSIIWVAGIFLILATFFGRPVNFEWSPAPANQTVAAVTLLGDFVAAIEVLSEGVAMFLLMQITIELARRQRLREQWVLGGADLAVASAMARESAIAAAAAGAAGASAASRAADARARLVTPAWIAQVAPPGPMTESPGSSVEPDRIAADPGAAPAADSGSVAETTTAEVAPAPELSRELAPDEQKVTEAASGIVEPEPPRRVLMPSKIATARYGEAAEAPRPMERPAPPEPELQQEPPVHKAPKSAKPRRSRPPKS
jgi:hypothetical protein